MKLTVIKSLQIGEQRIPFMGEVSAGFPSPASDFIEQGIDLNKELIEHPSATFYVRVNGHSMIKAGINDGDLLIIDRSLPFRNGSIVVCFLDGEFTLKRIKLTKNTCFLMPENENYSPIEITEENDLRIWGTVTYNISKKYVCSSRL